MINSLKIALISALTALIITLSCSCTRDITIHVHSYSSWETSEQPTCTKSGTMTRSCSCGDTETRSVDPLGHAYTRTEVIIPQTCTGRGFSNYTCKLCGDVMQKVESKLSHTPSEGYMCINEKSHARQCTVCLKTLTLEDHYYVDGVCFMCKRPILG